MSSISLSQHVQFVEKKIKDEIASMNYLCDEKSRQFQFNFQFPFIHVSLHVLLSLSQCLCVPLSV